MGYINVSEKYCIWSRECCWSCAYHGQGWSFPVCKECLNKRSDDGKYNKWQPRLFDRKKLEDESMDCYIT